MSDLINELKQLIIDSLDLEDVTPDDIDAEAPLFGEGLGLDSIDALELGLAIHKKFQVKLDANSEDTKKHFRSVASLAAFVAAGRARESA
jgi:acyl carrier protein